MKQPNKFLAYLKNHKKSSIAIAVVLVLIALVVTHSKKGAKYETATAQISDVIETVSVTGNVSPVDKADLSFEKGGTVSHIYVAVGDHVHAGDQIASLDSATDQANYESAAATLADMSRSLTPEEQSVEVDKVDAARVTARNAAHDAYTQAQAALVNYTDSLFSNAASINPTITIPTQSYADKSSIQTERVGVTQALNDWASDLQTASSSDPTSLVIAAQQHLIVVKSFVTDLSAIVNSLSGANTGLSQSTVNSYTALVNSALTQVNAASDSLTNAAVGLSQANSEYSLKEAGNSSDSIASQQAKADAAAAVLAQDTITSPIDGIVTAVTPNVGEFVPGGQTEFSVQSDGAFKIEAFVPESDIAKVAVGDYSSTTLDAYGSETYFGAKVVSIDPAETEIEGVPTYKVTLYFTENDPRIRSGMTANLDILTHERDNVVSIPYRALIDVDGTKYVRVPNAAGTAYASTTVQVGLKGSDGTIEIVSGLQAGQQVVTYIK